MRDIVINRILEMIPDGDLTSMRWRAVGEYLNRHPKAFFLDRALLEQLDDQDLTRLFELVVNRCYKQM